MFEQSKNIAIAYILCDTAACSENECGVYKHGFEVALLLSVHVHTALGGNNAKNKPGAVRKLKNKPQTRAL